MIFVTAVRIRLASKKLHRVNTRWQAHMGECVRCRLAATGSRLQRRSVKGRFCGAGGALLLEVEAGLEKLKALYPEKKVQQIAATGRQDPI